MFTNLRTAQGALDEWVDSYNTTRPHQGIDTGTPQQRFHTPTAPGPDGPGGAPAPVVADLSALAEARTGDDWVARRVAANGVVSVSWQLISVGKHHAGRRCDAHVSDRLLQFWIGADLIKTVPRQSTGEVRKKKASTTTNR